jgi:predicted SnoaL-like aldol condensation-catalyzing enzyme
LAIRGREVMGTQENKAVAYRFMSEVIAVGDLKVVDQVLAANDVTIAMGGADIAGVKTMLAITASVIKEVRIDDVKLVAEGDAVFARFNYGMTLPDGSTTTSRALAYYHLVDGKIDVDDVMFDPDIMGIVGPLMEPQ